MVIYRSWFWLAGNRRRRAHPILEVDGGVAASSDQNTLGIDMIPPWSVFLTGR
jgi:hypothetical protein